jgi:lipopolysaccharide/colanic/teichoic acid biosynthesis glycosyltransferase
MPRDALTAVLPAPAPAPARVGAVQRALDVTLAAGGLVLFAPLMLLIALAVFCDGGRPVLFAQTRLGAGGVPFRLYKFRKFSAREGSDGIAVTVAGDRRMTRIGALLAHSKMDELPQLFNVLAGEMSIVGPRPEALAFSDCFAGAHRAVLAFRPGIFGPNQVFLRNESALYCGHDDPESFYRRVLFPLKAEADLAYFPRRNLAGDLGWLVRGVLAVCGIATPARPGGDALAEIERWVRRHGVPALPAGG